MARLQTLLTSPAIDITEDTGLELRCSATQDLEPCTDPASYILIKGSRLSLLNDVITLSEVGADQLHRGFVPQGFVLCNAHMAQANHIVATVNKMLELAKEG